MMNHNHLKRRRPYGYEQPSVEPALPYSPPIPSTTGVHTTPFPLDNRQRPDRHSSSLELPANGQLKRQPDQQYILEQAASILRVPVTALVDFGSCYHQQPSKRPRLETGMTMASPYLPSTVGPDMPEKSPASNSPTFAAEDGRGSAMLPESSWSNWNLGSSAIGQMMSKLPFCPPCSGYETPTYQSVPTSASFEYANTRPYQSEIVSPIQAQVSSLEHGSGITSSPALPFGWEAPPDLQQYPPLEPTTSGEGMIYPGAPPPNVKLFKTESSDSDFVTPDLRNHPDRVDHLDQNVPYSDVMIGIPNSSSFVRSGSMTVGPSSEYGDLQGYAAPDNMGSDRREKVQMQVRPSNLDLVFSHQRAPPAKRGPFKDHVQRQQTAHTRKIGSCIRCRMQRIRCEIDPSEPDDDSAICLTCKRVSSSKIWRLPCKRWKITDVKLFKPGQVQGYEWTQRWKDSVLDDIGNWASADTKTIKVTEGYTGDFVELKVRQFIPQEGDRLERSWVAHGERKSVAIPPYAIVDMEQAKSQYDNYIKRGLVECCKKLLGPQEKLLWRTYAIAMKVVQSPSISEEERELLNNTLDLWMSIRLTTKSFEIVGDETLGMSRSMMDEDSPLQGSIPLPPVMGAQIDSILLNQTLPRLRRETLENLQMMTQKKGQKTWLTTYLVTFILLHNVALITKHDAGYAQKHGMKRRFAREDMVRQYHQGANVLLAYFHYCNKGVYPFSAECKDLELQTLAELDDATIAFVKYTRDYVTDHRREWDDLSHNDDYESDYYFVSQLFQQNWQPKETI